MIGKTDKTPQLNMYQVPLLQFINKEHELFQLSERIDWDNLEADLSDYYCIDNGRPSIPIRKIVGVVLLQCTFVTLTKYYCFFFGYVPAFLNDLLL